jgi:hypothetical protein
MCCWYKSLYNAYFCTIKLVFCCLKLFELTTWHHASEIRFCILWAKTWGYWRSECPYWETKSWGAMVIWHHLYRVHWVWKVWHPRTYTNQQVIFLWLILNCIKTMHSSNWNANMHILFFGRGAWVCCFSKTLLKVHQKSWVLEFTNLFYLLYFVD